MFTVTFNDASEHLAKQVRTLSAMKVFHLLPRYLSFQEWRRLDQCQVATELKTTQGAISKGLAELLSLKVVEKRRNGPAIEWRLSPDYGWRGDADSYDAAGAEGRRIIFPPGCPTTIEGRIRDIMEATSDGTSLVVSIISTGSAIDIDGVGTHSTAASVAVGC